MMKKNRYFPISALTLVVGAALAVCRLLRTIIPWGVLPELSISNMVLLSLAALLLDHYLVPGEKGWKLGFAPLSALVFGLLPVASGFAGIGEGLKLAVVGGMVFALTSWLFAQMQDRFSTGPATKVTPLFSALGLYLAVQCFSGVIL